MSRVLSLAGFEVTLIGRFWVIPEVDRWVEGRSCGSLDSMERCGRETRKISKAFRGPRKGRTSPLMGQCRCTLEKEVSGLGLRNLAEANGANISGIPLVGI